MVETVQTVGRLFWLVMPAKGEEGEEENYLGSTLRGGCRRGGSNIPPKSRSRIVGARCIAWDLGKGFGAFEDYACASPRRGL